MYIYLYRDIDIDIDIRGLRFGCALNSSSSSRNITTIITNPTSSVSTPSAQVVRHRHIVDQISAFTSIIIAMYYY